MNISSSWHTFYWRMRCDLYKFTHSAAGLFIDMVLPTATIVTIWGYVMPVLGLPVTIGGFVLLGYLVLSCAAIPYWDFGMRAMTDLNGEREIDFELTLPLSAAQVFLRYVCTWFIQISLVNSLNLVLGKFLLWYRFDLSMLSIPKYLFFYLLMNLCTSVMAAMMTFKFKNFDSLGRFWGRIGFQMIYLGGLLFPYIVVQKNIPWFSYALLLNPFTYIYEGMRGSVLGTVGFMNYWLCAGVVTGFTVLFAIIGYHWFCKRLDSV